MWCARLSPLSSPAIAFATVTSHRRSNASIHSIRFSGARAPLTAHNSFSSVPLSRLRLQASSVCTEQFSSVQFTHAFSSPANQYAYAYESDTHSCRLDNSTASSLLSSRLVSYSLALSISVLRSHRSHKCSNRRAHDELSLRVVWRGTGGC